MTPEYSRFLLGLAMLAVSAIAVVGWLYIATGGTEETDKEDDIKQVINEVEEAIANTPEFDNWLRTDNVVISSNNFGRKASIPSSRSSKLTPKSGTGYTNNNKRSTPVDDSWMYYDSQVPSSNSHCHNSSSYNHDCGSHDSSSPDCSCD